MEAHGPGAPGLAFAGGVDAAEAAVLAVAGRLGGAGLHVCVGAAGALSDPDAPGLLAERLLRSLPATEVAVTSDAVASHAGALAGEAGVVLAVGTGTVALAAGPGGTWARVDGCGPWLGDEGSGAAIGRAGLAAALRAEDGRGPATALTAAAVACYGVPVPALPGLIGSAADPARETARFAAPTVSAAGGGDPVAGLILDDAVAALLRTVHAAVARSGLPPPVMLALLGGVLRTGPAFTERLHAAFCTLPVRLTSPGGSALDGARLLATDERTIHERHVVRRRRPGQPGEAGC